MSIAYNTSVSLNGLTNYYDFKNPKSYPGSGTTWFDLVGGTNLTIAGAATFSADGYLTLAAGQTTQYIYNSAFPMPTGSGTLSIWFRIGTTSSPNQTPISYNYSGNDNNVLLFITGTTSIGPQTLADASWGITVPDMQFRWVNLTWTRELATGVENMYHNGDLVSTITRLAGTSRSAPGYLVLGQEQDSLGGSFDINQNLDGDIAAFAVYNRVLTAAEALQNFNAYRGRYSI